MTRIKIANAFFICAGLIAICCELWHLWDNVIYSDKTFSDFTKAFVYIGVVFYFSPLVGIYEKYIENHYKH